MTPEQQPTPDPNRARVRRTVTRGGHVVHVHPSADGAVLYVPVVPAWAEAALAHAMARLAQTESGRG